MMISRRNFLAVAGRCAACSDCLRRFFFFHCFLCSCLLSSAAATAEGGEKIVKVARLPRHDISGDESFSQACWTAVSGYMGDVPVLHPQADASDGDRRDHDPSGCQRWR